MNSVAPSAARPNSSRQNKVKTADKSLDLEYGPPIPGTDIPAGVDGSGKAIFNDTPTPLILPVQIHRDMLDSDGKINILLEVEIID